MKGIPKIFKGKPFKFAWSYNAADGTTLGVVARYEDSEGKVVAPFFKQNNAGWQSGGAGIPRPLFGLDVLAKADPSAPVFIPEGEKCAAALHSLGLIAVTSCGGSKAANTADWPPLAGRIVCLLPDCDETGRQYSKDVAAALAALETPPIKILLVELPGLQNTEDVVDWLFSKMSDVTEWDGFQPIPENERNRLADEFQKIVKSNAKPIPDEWKAQVEDSMPVSEWPAPVSLDAACLPTFPRDVFPSEVQSFVDDLAQATETPIEMSSMVVLSVLAAVAQGKYEVQVKPGYIEPMSLWACAALPPGTRKTAVLGAATAPLEIWEREQKDGMQAFIVDAESEDKTLTVKIQRMRNKAANFDGSDFKKLSGEIKELEASLPDIPTAPQIWTNDVTPENLGTIMVKNNERMAIFSDEGGIFDNMGGRYSKGVPNLDVFLKSHAGSAVRVNRTGRQSDSLQHPALTMGLTPQPEVLRGLTEKPGFRGRGLLARFLYVVPVCNLGYRTGNTPPMTSEVKGKYAALVTAILNHRQEVAPGKSYVARTLILSESALQAQQIFWQSVEAKMRDGGEFGSMRDWAGKLPGAAVRIAGVLHVAHHATGSPWEHPINVDTMSDAIRMAEVLSFHALAAFDMMGADPAIENARIILRWIQSQGASTFTFRDCHHKHQGRFKRAQEMEPAIEVLTERHFIRPVPAPKVAYRRSRIFEVNPAILS